MSPEMVQGRPEGTAITGLGRAKSQGGHVTRRQPLRPRTRIMARLEALHPCGIRLIRYFHDDGGNFVYHKISGKHTRV